ncbi:hypothetical protein CspHIS471_0103910 [Cutaneotrichosporon sp. HIS471]|nr:hypothetical protein CspHIS471_0103910 [Cutaneotrichosporon sp. HIS471]
MSSRPRLLFPLSVSSPSPALDALLDGSSPPRLAKSEYENNDFADDFDIDEWEIALLFPKPPTRHQDNLVFHNRDDLIAAEGIDPAITPTPHDSDEDVDLILDLHGEEHTMSGELDRSATPTPFNGGSDGPWGDDTIEDAFEESSRVSTPTPYGCDSNTSAEDWVEDAITEADRATIADDEEDDPGLFPTTQRLPATPKWVGLVSTDGTVVAVKSAVFGAASDFAYRLLYEAVERVSSVENPADGIPFIRMSEGHNVIRLFVDMLESSSSLLIVLVEKLQGEVSAVVEDVVGLFRLLKYMDCHQLRQRLLDRMERRPPCQLGVKGYGIPVVVGRFILGAVLDHRAVCVSALLDSLAPRKHQSPSMANDLAPLRDFGGLGKLIPPPYRGALDCLFDAGGCAITVDEIKAGEIFRQALWCWTESVACDERRIHCSIDPPTSR